MASSEEVRDYKVVSLPPLFFLLFPSLSSLLSVLRPPALPPLHLVVVDITVDTCYRVLRIEGHSRNNGTRTHSLTGDRSRSNPVSSSAHRAVPTMTNWKLPPRAERPRGKKTTVPERSGVVARDSGFSHARLIHVYLSLACLCAEYPSDFPILVHVVRGES